MTQPRADVLNQRAQEGGGFQSNHVFLNGPGGDHINPFSGDAETTVNIGPTLKAGGGLELGLTLQHSTKIWTRWDDGTSHRFRYIKRRGPFGVGWRLHLGRVYRSCRNGCGGSNWVYESSDGAQHPIQFGGSIGPVTYYGTTDSTYIRAEQYLIDPTVNPSATPETPTYNFDSATGAWRLYMGNGVVYTLSRRLDSPTVDPNHQIGVDTGDEGDDFRGWYTTRIERWDSPGNAVGRIDVTYGTGALAHCIQRIDFLAPNPADPAGELAVQRSITFVNDSLLDPMNPASVVEGGYTKEIHFPAVKGQDAATAVYKFDYQGPLTLSFNPPGSGLTTPYDGQFLLQKINFPVLDPGPPSVTVPPMEFTYDGVTGDLVTRKLPTGAAIRYDYETYSYDATPATTNIITWLRKVTRKCLYVQNPGQAAPNLDPTCASADGVWTYSGPSNGFISPPSSTVRDAFGNETVYLFGATECPSNCEADWYRTLTTGVKVYQGSAESGVLVRTHKTRYTIDGYGILPVAEWTVYHDEQGKLSGTRRLNLGPFGHFQTINEYGFVGPSVTGELPFAGPEPPYRQTTFTYDELTGDTAADRWKLWFIHKTTAQVVSDAAGTPVRKTTSTYLDDGRITKQVTFLDPAGTDANAAENIVTEYLYDASTANLQRSYTHKAGEATPAYGSRLEYDNNVFLKKSFVLNPNFPTSGDAFSYASKELVRDPNSGAVIATVDPAGIRTDLHFDVLGRLTRIAPPTSSSESPTEITYPSISVTVVKRVTADSNNFIQTKYLYDTLGRLVETRRRTETGCEAIQKTVYDVAGRAEFVNEWGFGSGCTAPQLVGEQLFDANSYDPASTATNKNIGTRFLYYTGDSVAFGTRVAGARYDPLGRLQQVITADRESTTASYSGAGTTVKIGNVDGQPSSTYYERDAFGNLVLVDAPMGADGRYTYNVLGELLKVELISTPATGAPFIQPRSFTYDALGRLRSSTNPESGTVRFTRYDAVGRLLEKLDSDGTKFSFSYDAAGRMILSTAAADVTGPNTTAPRVYDPAHNLAQYFYDEAGVANGAGKLTRVDSYDETGALLSRRKLSYGGLNSRLSEEATTFAWWDGREGIDTTRDKELRTCYFYDELGLLKTLRYPTDAACQEASAPAGVAQLAYTYKNGALASITDAPNRTSGQSPGKQLIQSVVFNAAGGMRQVVHGNGRATSVAPDKMSRPANISVVYNPSEPETPTNSMWQTGQYTFDGAGNILSIGPGSDPSTDVFDYDLLSRLKSATVHYRDGSGTAHRYDLTYQFDDFGNLADLDGVSPPMSPVTKKLDGVDQPTPMIDPSFATNRLAIMEGLSASYDQRGNLLGNSAKKYLFDERNRLLAVGESPKTYPVGQYAYDAAGMRVMKSKPGSGERTFYIRDGGGNVLTEFTLPPHKYDEFYQKDYFYALGRVIGMAEEKSPPPVEGFYGAGSWEEEFGQVTLDWTASTQAGIKYRVFRKTGVNGTWAQRGSDLPAGTGTFSEGFSTTGLPTYFYRVAAFDPATGLEGIPSRTLRFPVGSTLEPSPPAGLTLQTRDRSLTLRWQRSADDVGYTGTQGDPFNGFQGYQVYRQNDASGWDKINLLPLTDAVFHDLAATDPAKTYSYQVRAINTTWIESAGSVVISGKPGDYDPPAPPTGVRALSGWDAGQITVVWNPSAESDLAGYSVYQKQADGSYMHLGSVSPGSTPQYPVPNLTQGTSFTFAVAAKDASNFYSALSADASARPRVSVPAPPPFLQEDQTRNMTWTDNRAYALLKWGATSQASTYRVYRKLEEQHWSAYQPIFSDPLNHVHTDWSFDWCRAHMYLFRAVDANGDESADPNDEVFSERILRPNPPVPTGNGVDSITLNWGGIVGCQPQGNGYAITKWKIGPVVIDDPNITTHTFSGLPSDPNISYAYAVVARVRNLHRYAANPNDPLAEFDSFISDDICTTINGGNTGTGCADLAGNDPPPGGGGGGGTCQPPSVECPHDEEPATLIRRIRAGLSLPFDSEPLRIAKQGEMGDQPLAPAREPGASDGVIDIAHHDLRERFGDGRMTEMPEGSMLMERHTPVVAAALRLPTLPQGAGACTENSLSESASPHRIIGTPSPKQFRFTFFHWDHLGSVRVVTNEGGAKVAESKFLPFGEEILGTGWPGNSHQFTGHERDAESSLDYMLARYYGKGLSRFLSADPLGGPGDGAQAGNKFAYVNDNPIRFTDPLGLYRAGSMSVATTMSSGPVMGSYQRLGSFSGVWNSSARGIWDDTRTAPDPPRSPWENCAGMPVCGAAESGGEEGSDGDGDGDGEGEGDDDAAQPWRSKFTEYVRVTANKLAQVPWQVTAAGPQFGPLAFSATWRPSTGDLWLAGGFGLNFPQISFTGGPLFGDYRLLDAVMTGWSWNGDFALGSLGAQATWSESGSFGGPTSGAGVSVNRTYTLRRFQLPRVRF